MCSTAPKYPICAKYPTLYPPECPKCSAYSDLSSSSEYAQFNKFVQDVQNYEESQFQTYSFAAGLRKFWEEWDLRIIILYILCIQLYLIISGRLRRRSKRKFLIFTNVSWPCTLAELLAAVALGKLSIVKDEGKFNKRDEPESLSRGLWAPIILFYLGGPDTTTLLYIQENQPWMTHLVSLLTQGARTCYVLIVTWTPSGLTVLSLLMLISGIMKYAERIWVIKSRTREISKGLLKPKNCSTDTRPVSFGLKNQTKLVVEGYISFQILMPHIPGYRVYKGPLEKFIEEDRDPEDIFKQIEIELGFMYDLLFSKEGTIFIAWGFILRYITLSSVVCVLVGFFMVDMARTEDLKDDRQITIVLLLGAIFLEIVGLLRQLVSDWAVVWAWKHPQSKLSSPVLFLHEHLISKRRRWSEEVGQFILLKFCTECEATVFDRILQAVLGRSKLLSINFSLPSSKAKPSLKRLIINQLRERSQTNSGQTSRTSSMKAGEWTLTKCGFKEASKWTMNIEFGEAIVLWHLATDICYHSKDEKPEYESEAAKILSYYMMHLLLICPNTLPFCNTDGDFLTACKEIMEILKNQKLTLAAACERLKEIPPKECESIAVKRAKHLASALMQKSNEERWEIMSSMWVEMLCYAAKECQLKYHAEDLILGGEFLTLVWLLLIHFGIYGDQDRIIPPYLRACAQEGIEKFNDLTQSTFGESWVT